MVSVKRIVMRGLTALVLVTLVGFAGLVAVSPVLAQESEACSVSINSASANDATVELAKDEGISLRVIDPEDSVHNDVYLKFFGQRVKISKMDGDEGEFQGTFPLSDVSGWGVGLYELVWESLDIRARSCAPPRPGYASWDPPSGVSWESPARLQ